MKTTDKGTKCSNKADMEKGWLTLHREMFVAISVMGQGKDTNREVGESGCLRVFS